MPQVSAAPNSAGTIPLSSRWSTPFPLLNTLSFVTEPPSDEMKRDPSRLEVFKDYVRNIARWLGARAEHNTNARENGDVRAPRSAARAAG